MSSQYCTHCLHKGDIKACKAIECFAHESWYALEMIAENAKLVEALEKIASEKVMVNDRGSDLANYLIADIDHLQRIAMRALQQLKEND